MLVVGAGMAGVAAAIEAAQAGARVLVLDRGGRLSCTSAMAGGHFYLGGGTPCQQAGGFDDTPAEMAKYLTAVSPDCDPEKIRLYTEGSVEHFHWLESLGFEFERSYYPGKAVMAPGTEGVMFSGNEKVWPFRDIAVPAPRGHQPPVEGDIRRRRARARPRPDEAGRAGRRGPLRHRRHGAGDRGRLGRGGDLEALRRDRRHPGGCRGASPPAAS